MRYLGCALAALAVMGCQSRSSLRDPFLPERGVFGHRSARASDDGLPPYRPIAPEVKEVDLRPVDPERPDPGPGVSLPAPTNDDPRPTLAEQSAGAYSVRPGDRLEVLFLDVPHVDVEHLFAPGDLIRVEYLHLGAEGIDVTGASPVRSSGLDRTALIEPDGRVSLPYLGAVAAAGRSASQLSEQLTAAYRRYYVDPNILVSLAKPSSPANRMREASQGSITRVAPDGTINLPTLGVVAVAGLTVSELQREVAARYRRATPRVDATIRLAEPARIASPANRE